MFDTFQNIACVRDGQRDLIDAVYAVVSEGYDLRSDSEWVFWIISDCSGFLFSD